ncbi:protein SABRE-like isoform X2 [Phoenix dactylifera]|uniref:Protein SABRE-like isoform X2 n=1 Tax=Phoenix dactylifera TaxID=42345 RepID=A0A8B7MWU4_PHODC|nr:protein SABRE-like isoform X2 [Phoenix dactylifera]
MASPVKFLFALLIFCAVGWAISLFAARLLAWFLSRIMGASVGFQVAGCNCLRDITLSLRKGSVEYLSIGEIKVVVIFVSRSPKMQFLISDVEVVLRPTAKSIKKSKPKRSRSVGRGRWMILTNMTRFLSVSVKELILKAPKAATVVKDLKVDISKNEASNSVLDVKLHLISFLVQICDSQLSFDQSSSFYQGGYLVAGQTCSTSLDMNCAPFMCEDLSITCQFGHHREQGVKINNLDVTCGDIIVNLNENLFIKTKREPDTSTSDDGDEGATLDFMSAKKLQKNKFLPLSIKKHIFLFPEKVSFNMPKLDVKFLHCGQDFSVNNSVMGIDLRSTKSQRYEDSGEVINHIYLQMNFSEIHVLRGGSVSVLEILKVAVMASIDIPMQPPLPIGTEIHVKLGGSQCNIITSRLKPLISLHLAKKKRMVLHEETSQQESSPADNTKAIIWTCTVSTPQMAIMLYSVDELPLYQACLQSCHLLANNIERKGIQLHAELGKLHLNLVDKCQESLKESLYGVEVNLGSFVDIARVSLDWGQKDMEKYDEHDPNRRKLVFSINITDMGIYFCFQHVESLIVTLMSFKTLLKSLSPGKRAPQNKVGHICRKKTAKGTQILKLSLEKFSIIYCGNVSMEDMTVADPKRVNFGSQGGEVLISVSADGTPRTASIISTSPSGYKHLKFSTSLDIIRLRLCLNKEKHSMQTELERARSVYHEYPEENRAGTKVTLLDMQKAKFVRRSGGVNDVAVCSFFNVTDISVRWEPDPHLALLELVTCLRSLLYSNRLESSDNDKKEESIDLNKVPGKEVIMDQVQTEKQRKKKESVFAIDLEMLKVSAELADGVEAIIHVQSIFSENARIGVLLEGIMLSFNEARVFKSSRMQISRVPVSKSNLPDSKIQSAISWDWAIRSPDVHICMPYRLQLRAVDDAVEDTLRGLKLIAAAKTNLIFPVKKSSTRKSKTKSTKFGTVRFIIRRLTADIEEEPIQGWLDEHYQLMKNEVCNTIVRSKLLDEYVSESNQISENAEPNAHNSEKKIRYNGIEIDASDMSSAQNFQEEIYKEAFRSYYLACQKMVISEGSGACITGFQSGFKSSMNRSSLLSLCATELDVTLTRIDGGDAGMVDFIRKTDPVCSDNEIPFSRMYGSDIVLNAGSLVAKIRNYSFPLFSGTAGKCQGRVVLAQQATCFQPQMQQDVFVGRWWRVRMLRSASGTTPPMKTYYDLPLYFHKGEVSFGVGYEPVLADISYAFTVALRRVNLGTRHDPSSLNEAQPPKKERSLPWWDDMRYYIHGKASLCFVETKWYLLGTTNPYEQLDRAEIISGYMEIQQRDGHVCLSMKEFKIYVSSIESLTKNCSLKPPCHVSEPLLYCPAFSVEVFMEWGCESGNPLNHYLHALPVEGEPHGKVYDPFRSTSLSLKWNFSLKSSLLLADQLSSSSSMEDIKTLDGSVLVSSQKLDCTSPDSPTINLGAHDLFWLINWWNLYYLPPQKLRSFSRWPRFGVPRVARSGNLSLDKVMTEFFLRIDASPTCINFMPLRHDDPAKGVTVRMTKLKLELYFSRGKQKYTFNCKREPLDLVYQGLDLHLLKAYLNRNVGIPGGQDIRTSNKSSQTVKADKFSSEKWNYVTGCTEKTRDDGFLLYSDYFTIRRQAPKADSTRLSEWQEAGRKSTEMTHVKSEFDNGSEGDHMSDDDGYNVVIADNCQRVFVYGLKILWNLENRDAVLSLAGGLSKAFEPPKPSPSRQYAQRKLLEGQVIDGTQMPLDDSSKSCPSASNCASSYSPQPVNNSSHSPKMARHGYVDDSEEEGTRQFMVNVIQPQFNLHSEEANGRFLLAAASGRVLARSFHSVLHVGYEMIEQALCTSNVSIPVAEPEMMWHRVELSVMLENVQAHVAPTDVDPGAGVQWLPKILRSSPKVKRTGALLERVFMPCEMYFRYTRHKGGTPELKVKPLKELTFNSPNITATMTSRQFQVMLDVLTNLLFARVARYCKNTLSYPFDDEDTEEETDEIVPDGVEEVELAKINLEQREREQKLLLDDMRNILVNTEISDDLTQSPENDSDLWMITGAKSMLVQGLKKELEKIKKLRKEAYSALRVAVQKAAQLRLLEKEKNKSPSYAMRISVRINQVIWSMLQDGKSIAEAEINDMIYDFDRDYKDIGVAQFTIKSFVLRNCMPNAKSDVLLSAWNAPPEWGKSVMLRVNAKQGSPKDGNSTLERFQVEIYPLKIYLTETMYRMMWSYFFPEEEQDSQKRQEVWKVSTTAGSRRVKKGTSGPEVTASGSNSTKDGESPGRSCAITAASVTAGTCGQGDSSQASKSQNQKENTIFGSKPGLRRTSSFDRTWEETVAESVANELVLQVHSSSISSSKSGSLNAAPEYLISEETSKNKAKDYKAVKSSRSSQEEKKAGKTLDEKRDRPRRMIVFHSIKISQVELLLTYEGPRFAVSDLRLLMDTFHRDDFIGTWTRLFSRVKKHIIWGVLKSVTGMQGKKFKDKSQSQRESHGGVVPEGDLDLSDSDGGQPGRPDQLPTSWIKRPSDGAGDGFVTSIRGLFNSQRRKAKVFVLRTMRGEADNEFQGDWSENDVEFSPFARQLTITKAKKLIRRHTKKFRSRAQNTSELTLQQEESHPSSSKGTTQFASDSSGASSYEDQNE